MKPYDDRRVIKVALKTSEEREAIKRAEVYHEYIEHYWKGLVQSSDTDPQLHKYKATVLLAQSYGFAYKTTYELAEVSIEELIKRVSQTTSRQETTHALLGGVDRPTIKLSNSLTLYWDLTIDRLVNKDDHKIRKWRNPRAASLKNFIAICGDKQLTEITRTDVLSFKEWWRGNIATGHSPATANKQLQMTKDILRTVGEHLQLELGTAALFANTKFRQQNRSRPPFEAQYVQDILLPSIADLNERDRMVIYAIADTGARESEIFGLRAEDIFLKEPIPYIWIRARKGYSLKTVTSERKIPLVGTALYAFRKHPQGFQHKGNPDVFSSIVNKYLTTKKLRPTPEHSIYSLRHTFKDRLRDIGAPEELIDGLMGHKKKGPQYGRGHKKEATHNWLQKIAYQV